MEIKNLKDVPEYLPVIARWHHDEWQDYNPGLTFERRLERMQVHLADELVPSTLVAIHDTQAVGSAAIGQCDMPSHPELTPWLESVFVVPAHRQQGIASALVKAMMLHAARQGVEQMYLFTPDRQTFYEKMGWQFMLKESYRGHDVTVMSICLSMS